MQFVRLIIWILIFVVLVLLTVDWLPVGVAIWDDIILETKVPALVIIAFLVGLLPMWILHQVRQWHLMRRIRSLENAAQTATAALAASSPEAEAEPIAEPFSAPAPEPSSETSAPSDENPKPDQA